jgi:hypothetical protein
MLIHCIKTNWTCSWESKVSQNHSESAIYYCINQQWLWNANHTSNAFWEKYYCDGWNGPPQNYLKGCSPNKQNHSEAIILCMGWAFALLPSVSKMFHRQQPLRTFLRFRILIHEYIHPRSLDSSQSILASCHRELCTLLVWLPLLMSCLLHPLFLWYEQSLTTSLDSTMK